MPVNANIDTAIAYELSLVSLSVWTSWNLKRYRYAKFVYIYFLFRPANQLKISYGPSDTEKIQQSTFVRILLLCLMYNVESIEEAHTSDYLQMAYSI